MSWTPKLKLSRRPWLATRKPADGLGLAPQHAHVVPPVEVGEAAARRCSSRCRRSRRPRGASRPIRWRTARECCCGCRCGRQRVRGVSVGRRVGVAFVLGARSSSSLYRLKPQRSMPNRHAVKQHELPAFAHHSPMASAMPSSTSYQAWKHHDVAFVPIDRLQPPNRRHRVLPDFLHVVPHLAKAEGRHRVSGHHCDLGRLQEGHVVGSQVGSESTIPEAQRPTRMPATPSASASMRAACHPKGFVVASRDHQGAARPFRLP